MSWPTNRSEFGENRIPVLIGVSSADGQTVVPVAVDAATGAIITETSGSGSDAVNLIKVGGSAIALGQTTKSASLPVTLASDTGTLPVSISGNQAVNLAQVNGVTTTVIGSSGTQTVGLTNGTNIADVMAPGTPSDSGNAVLVGGTSQTVTWTTTSATAVAATDVGNYRFASIQVTTQGTNAVHNVQGSNDNSNWFVLAATNVGVGNTIANTCSATGVYSVALNCRYFRINVTGISAGTSSGLVVFSTLPAQHSTLQAQQVGTWTVGANSATGSAVPANAFYIAGIAGSNLTGINVSGNADATTQSNGMQTASFGYVYNGSSSDRQRTANAAAGTTGTGLLGAGTMIYDGTNWQRTKDGTALGDGDTTGYMGVEPRLYNGSTYDRARSGGVTGMAGVSLQASASGGYSYLHIAAGQATTTVKSGAGTLHAIVFNSAATATNVTTIYDNTAGSGTVIGIPAATAVTTPESVIYDLAFATGLTFVTATANGSDMTVVYK